MQKAEARRAVPLELEEPRSINAVVRYAIPLASCGFALLVTLVLASELTQVIFVFFWPAVFASAWFGGRGPARVATVLSVALVNHFFVHPLNTTLPEMPEEFVGLLAFLVVGGAVGEVTARFREVQGELRRTAREAAERAQELQEQAIELEAQTEEAEVLTEELEQTNAELSESERRFRRMFDGSPLPMWVVDVETLRFLAVNESAIAHYGHSRDEFLAMTVKDVRPPSEIPQLEAALEAARDGSAAHELHRHWTKDKTVIDVEVSTQEIDYAGRRARVAIIVDVTDRERLFRAEQAARAEAERANKAKTDFLATMSHELRTPLNAIAGYAELMEVGIHGPITDKQRESLTRIQRSQRHLLSLINDVLNFAKLSAGRVKYEITDVPLRVAVGTVEELVTLQLQGKSLEFVRSDCDDGWVVRADPDKLQQILLNLLSNAIKFTSDGGSVRITCAGALGMVSITVADTGMGIPEDRLAHIFEPFVQVDRGLTSRHEGTGLGLSISRDLARGMGGDIVVHSELGRGSKFTLTLPSATSRVSQ